MRAWPTSSWRHRSRFEDVRSALAELAVLASGSDALARPAVPDAGPHALADQLEVLARDAEQAGAGPDRVEQIFAALSARLGLNQ